MYTMRWWSGEPGRPQYVAVSPRLRLYRHGRRSLLQAAVFALGMLRVAFARTDVVVADQMPYLHLFPLRMITRWRRLPLLTDWHELWGDSAWKSYAGWGWRFGSSLERRALTRATHVVADSPTLAASLERWGVPAARLRVVGNGLDRAVLDRVSPTPDRWDAAFVGRLMPHKRADLAIRAFARVATQDRSRRLAIIGDGPEHDTLTALCRELQVESQVGFLGELDKLEDVWAVLRGARVLLAPSEREGFGLAVGEALALGTPVVCSDSPENEARQLVSDGLTGSVVAAGDVDAVARECAKWLAVDDGRDERKAAFWKGHSELDWDRSAIELTRLLASVARQPQPGPVSAPSR